MDTGSSLRLAFAGALTALVVGVCGGGGGCSDDGGGGPEPWVTLTSPAGGENWAVGTGQEIAWECAGLATVRIELSRDGGGTWEDVAPAEDAGAGSFAWTVAGACSHVCLVRVSAAADESTVDTGEKFTIWSGIVWYVDDDAAGGDGTTWATAFQHPQDAVDAASAGDEAWVAAGTYKRRDAGDWALLWMEEGIAIYGGIATGATSREGRDLVANETILDGDADGDEVGDVESVVIGDSDARLDGFTVTRGNASGDGGGMYNYTSYTRNLTVANCTFVDNIAQGAGGGMYNGVEFQDVGSFTIINCTFVRNSAGQEGGGVCNRYGSPVLTNCVFTANSAGEGGGGLSNDRGPVYEITNCTFSRNSANVGGAICNYGRCLVYIRNCILWADNATTGEAEIHNVEAVSRLVITHSCVQGEFEGIGNFDADPLFVDPAAGDLSLQARSPCIDAGDGDVAPATDMDGYARHDDPGTVNCGGGEPAYTDIGAHEFQGGSTGRWLELSRPPDSAWYVVEAELQIVWRASMDFSEVKIELSRDGGANWETLAESTANDGSFAWTVADGGVGLPQTDCVLTVSDASDAALSDSAAGIVIFAGILYVDADAPAGGDGMTWDTALNHPQEALAVSPVGAEVRVAEGTYCALAPEDTEVITMKRGVALLGGFAGRGEADPDARDVSAHETVLHGEDARRVVVGAPDSTLDGFTVTHGFSAGYGGGMYNVLCGPVVRNCSFLENEAGDAIAAGGGGMANVFASTSVVDCVFARNLAGWGGGMKSVGRSPDGTPVVVSGCRFVSNIATSGSGGMDNFALDSIVITNCIFWANDGASCGGGMHSERASPVITNCTFCANSASQGGGIHSDAVAGTPVIRNCIVWANTAGLGPQIKVDGVPCAVSYSCVEGGWAGVGNIGDLPEHDPLFVDPDGPNDTLGDEDDDFHLSAGSPCIDAGDPASTLTEDIDGDPRPAGSGFDMGAYEHQP